MTLPPESINWISSEGLRFAFAPFVVAPVKGVFDRLGSAARPAPLAATSCSVPVWIRVLSPTVQLASMQPPPIPIQSDDDSACPAVCCVAVGTVQSPVIALNSLLPCSSVPWLYPNQLLLCAALMPTPGFVM